MKISIHAFFQSGLPSSPAIALYSINGSFAAPKRVDMAVWQKGVYPEQFPSDPATYRDWVKPK